MVSRLDLGENRERLWRQDVLIQNENFVRSHETTIQSGLYYAAQGQRNDSGRKRLKRRDRKSKPSTQTRIIDQSSLLCASRARSNNIFWLVSRRFRRATNARLSCAMRRARGDSDVREGCCETSSKV